MICYYPNDLFVFQFFSNFGRNPKSYNIVFQIKDDVSVNLCSFFSFGLVSAIYCLGHPGVTQQVPRTFNVT